MRTWVTRTAPAALATGARLASLGHAPLVAPLLEVSELADRGPPPTAAALAFTSVNAVTIFAATSPERKTPVFAVGAATARLALEAGFVDVRSADGDVAALAAAILADAPGGPVLHPCAREAAGDLAGPLAAAGLELRPWPIYGTEPVAALPEPASRALAEGAVDAVLLQSPKAARVLAALVTEPLRPRLGGVWVFGQSPACLSPLSGLPFAGFKEAPRPSEDALLALLK